eukprot:2833632-Rhodomonas_salina.1
MPDKTRVVVADRLNHVLRVVWLYNGTTYTLSGTGSSGYVNGAALATQFNEPYDVAFISTTEILVADFWNNVIRLVNAVTGESSLFAGEQGSGGWEENDVGRPEAITVLEGEGLAVISDPYQRRVRFLNLSSGAISVPRVLRPLQGDADGVGTGVRFRFAVGLVWSQEGSWGLVYDETRNKIRKVDYLARSATTVYSGGVYSISIPRLSRDDRTVFFLQNGVFVKFDLETSVTTRISGQEGVWGYKDGNESVALFSQESILSGAALTPDESVLVISSVADNSIRTLNLTSGEVRTLTGGNGNACVDGPRGTAALRTPRGLVVTPDGLRVLVVDYG